ncbi:helix-turn-helix domain-containing protein [Defluviicoccus vanus]|uniref:Helix-turn-helix transcriptional regulator n=1 Tax=Defluviicoccus vanus TaxID=111831 RepID=A0A7H1N1U5_9PROT|nr:helix-turn-helix transcriptional regulator [Defluviicoccus vanus]QNT69681.1 helix-turn-helix transcriptional regulator [Defluviicoccus vanus]
MQSENSRQINRHIGSGLLLARTVRGASLKQLANATGLSMQRLERLEIGTAEATPRDLLLLAASLGIPVQFFFEGLEDEVHEAARHQAAVHDCAVH